MKRRKKEEKKRRRKKERKNASHEIEPMHDLLRGRSKL